MSVINTNMFSLHAQRQVGIVNRDQQVTMERLSSGQRINQAKDDAYGIALSGEIAAQKDGMGQMNRNASDGISLIQVANGAMDNIASALQRMRELSLQSASGTYNGLNREQTQQEFEALQNEISRVALSTEFNGVAVLNRPENGAEDIQIQVGMDSAGATTSGYFHSAAMALETRNPNHVASSDGDGGTSGSYAGLTLSGASGLEQNLTIEQNAEFTIEVDGIASGTVVIPAGSNTNEAWATLLQEQINSDSVLSDAGKAVGVQYDEQKNAFVFQSNAHGDGSSIRLPDQNITASTSFKLKPFGATVDGQNSDTATAAELKGASISNASPGINLIEPATFSMRVDGVTSESITLAAGSESKEEWAATIQSAINNDPLISGAEKQVVVTYDQATDAFHMASTTTGEISQLTMLSASNSMAALGFRNESQATVVSLENLTEAERQISFVIDGESQPAITLPAVVKTPEEWASYLQEQMPEASIYYDQDQQLQIDSRSDGYGSTISFEGSIPHLGITPEGETFNGYGNINKINITHYDFDDQKNALGGVLINSENISTQESASNMLGKLDQAIDYLNQARSHIGAVQNRLDTVTEQIQVRTEDAAAAHSQIHDADFAAESSEMAKNQILQQAAIAMMAQANKLPEQMLQTMLR